MTLLECYEKHHALIVWQAIEVNTKFPEDDIDDIVHAAYLHIARYADRCLAEEEYGPNSVRQLAKWGMLRHCLKEMKLRNRQKTVIDPLNDSYRLDAMPSRKYIPKCERLKHSIRHFPDPSNRVYVDEILRTLTRDERNLLLRMAVIGDTAIEIGHEVGKSNLVVWARYNHIRYKIQSHEKHPEKERRRARAKPL